MLPEEEQEDGADVVIVQSRRTPSLCAGIVLDVPEPFPANIPTNIHSEHPDLSFLFGTITGGLRSNACTVLSQPGEDLCSACKDLMLDDNTRTVIEAVELRAWDPDIHLSTTKSPYLTQVQLLKRVEQATKRSSM